MIVKSLKYISNSQLETIDLGSKLGSHLNIGDVVALIGDLGSGKTWFAKGLALGLDVEPDTVITSPSFALVNEYKGRVDLYHMDFYRLEETSEIIGAGLEEYIYKEGVVVIEWADRCPEILPEQNIKIEISIVDDHRRDILLSGQHPHSIDILDSIEQEVNI